MSDKDHSSKTIGILVMIALLTVALLGAEAWNRDHKKHPHTTPAAAVPPAPTESKATAQQQPQGKSQSKQTAPAPSPSGEVLMNE